MKGLLLGRKKIERFRRKDKSEKCSFRMTPCTKKKKIHIAKKRKLRLSYREYYVLIFQKWILGVVTAKRENLWKETFMGENLFRGNSKSPLCPKYSCCYAFPMFIPDNVMRCSCTGRWVLFLVMLHNILNLEIYLK